MNVRKNIPKIYDGPSVEKRLYEEWVAKGFFQADPEADGEPFSIVMPPPNVTGSLHMGHALNITLQDILARWKRMTGHNVLWVPGTDHAGIATQNVVERQLLAENRHRTDLGRKKFENLVWDWKEKYEARILGQIRRLGCSCDWSRTRFTMDEGLSRAVREVFVQLYEDDLIYRGEYLVNWCPRCATAISDLEVEHREVTGTLWHLRYPLKSGDGFVVVATTRPETMLGDTAVAVHPEDDRYQDLIGQVVNIPLTDREIPIIADAFVDRAFGSGAVKVTPGHDANDFEAGQRNNLATIQVIGPDGAMTGKAGAYEGLDRFDARKKIICDLEALGLIDHVDDHPHNIGTCHRCDTVVEPLVSKQWFVKVQDLAEEAIQAVKDERTIFVPSRFTKVYLDWMENIHDWCISRQLWWGHRIPAWYCEACGETIVALQDPDLCIACGSDSLTQEEDVLDTWFSSGLWPFSTMGWPGETRELETYYPTSTLVTAFDIIFFWVARMMMLGLRFKGDVPFRQVHINGLVRDEDGQKMSKSKGNVIDPLGMIDEYGADAMRFTLSVMAVPGTDIPFSESRMSGYRAFCNKIWNAGRFLLLNLNRSRPVDSNEIQELLDSGSLELEDRWILARLQQVSANVHDNLSKFRFHEASNELYHFFWDEYCSWYIEFTKARRTNVEFGDEACLDAVSLFSLDQSLRLLHPFIPFVTEELWQILPHEGETLMRAEFPECKAEWIDSQALEEMNIVQDLISSIRSLRTEKKLDPRKNIPCQVQVRPDFIGLVMGYSSKISNLAGLTTFDLVEKLSDEGIRVRGVSEVADFDLLLDEVIDIEAEKKRLRRQIDKLSPEVSILQVRMKDTAFLDKAPPKVVEKVKQRLMESKDRLAKLQEQLDGFSS
jgi:valyl-tRNA synthetase